LKVPANDVIVIKDKNGKEILLPLVLEFIEKFEPVTRTLFLKSDVDLSDDED
jgi:ribosomal 30S subunit maturation factor RimM